MSNKPLISVVGSINIDFTTVVPRHPAPGETLRAISFSANAGGKGANQACACGRASFVKASGPAGNEQDVDVELIGAVGADNPFYASLVRPTLESSGVNLRGVEEAQGVSTGTATVIVDKDSGENRIMIVHGANFTAMSDADEQIRKITNPRRPNVIVLQGEIPRHTVQEIIANKKGLLDGTKTIWNAAPVFDEMIPWEHWRSLYALVVNETELAQVAKVQGGFDELLGRVDDEQKHLSGKTLSLMCNEFHARGPRIVLVTLGARGSFYSMSDGIGRISDTEHGFVQASTVEHVADTTAAGDTFVGYFAVTLARWAGQREKERFNIKRALVIASAAAAQCVQKPGAMTSVPWAYEL